MHDRLDDLINEAAPSYRVPVDPPLDAIWEGVEAEHFDTRRAAPFGVRRWPRWGVAVSGIAATLLIGVGIGRFTAPSAPAFLDPAFVEATARPVSVAEPLQRTTSQYLDEAALLLASLPSQSVATDEGFTAHASRLLTMTRLLLDSPAARDPRLRDLLQDLELVLAQVARLKATPPADEITFITAAMDERDVVPRLRTAAASITPVNF